MATLTCPHCRFSKDVPEEKLPDRPVRLRCRKCGGSFLFDPGVLAVREGSALSGSGEPAAPEPDPASFELPPVIDLFARSWAFYRRRIWLLLGIYLVTILMTMVPAVGAGVVIGVSAGLGNGPGLGSLILVGVAILLAMMLMPWGMIAMIYATVDGELGFKASFAAARDQYWAFCWMFSLLAFIVCGGGLLLIVPGLLFATWFLFAQYILAAEGDRGMDSLLKSREYVRGYFWAVLLRLLVLWVSAFLLMLVLGWIPLVGDLLSLFLFPFTLVYQYFLYCDLREAPREKIPSFWETGTRLRWPAVAALGYLVLPVAFWMIGGMSALDGWVLSWKIGHGLVSRSVQNWTPPPVIEEKLGQEPPAAVRISRRKMRRLLKRTRIEVPPGGVSVGPAALAADRFWDGGSTPHLWLKVRLADLPNLALVRDRAVSISIDRVTDGDGADRYDATSMFEKEFFRRVTLQASSADAGYLEGTRDVYLRRGTDEEDLRGISGVLHLKLPVGIEVVDLTPSMMGRDYTVAGHDISYKKLEGPAVTLALADSDNLLQVVGYNAAGKPLAPGGSHSSEQDGRVTRTWLFQGDVFSVRLYVARTLVKKDYPFRLTLPES
ncbi:zinc-ribbon domain-containing protein [Geothermobacter hydrogeniphilus]|uniref:Zinc finger/thioredoxin putative domain-containing protein n=1 Tax=Geothermobacter hydrogeniphilus TaxID=1969733 RepID=A0A1X0YAD0_9BACT|nr:zinc-ribbon domain-containing protein [Geothermobacter hydrogeniphilus]ORJ62077.1 hypothetical protein B5V00_04820 [Geothermobacter hydrogeniphilus]